MRLSIWGSCVSRDAFEVGVHPFEITYHARTSWVSQASAVQDGPTSLVQPPVTPPPGTGFGDRMVREDLLGEVVQHLVDSQPDVLLIDLIDERFDLVRVGPRWYTMSDYYGRADLEAPMRAAAEEVVAYRTPERAELFGAAVARVAPHLARALPQTRVVLQQAWYTARSIDPSAGEFYATATRHAVTSNEALSGFYKSLRRSFGRRLHVIEPDRSSHLYSDPAHRWGLMHFHYVPGYYDDVLADVLDVARGPVSPPLWRRRPSSRPPSAAEIDRQPSAVST